MDFGFAFGGRGRGGFGHFGHDIGHHFRGHHERGRQSHEHHEHGQDHQQHGRHEQGHPEHGHFHHGHHRRGHEHHPHGHHFHGNYRHGHEHGPFGHHFDSSDDEMMEIAKEISRDEYKKQCKRGHCNKSASTKKVSKNSVHPVWTVVETKGGKFTVSIPLGKDAKAEDVKLSIKDLALYIGIKLEESSEDGTSHLSQVFMKKINLPEEVEVEGIRSNLTPEGVLKIEASVAAPEEISIPVSMHSEPSVPPAGN